MAAFSAAAAPTSFPWSKALPLPLRQSYRAGARPFSTSALVCNARLSSTPARSQRIICLASSSAGSAGSSQAESDENPYEVLGVNPIEGFDMVKATYKRRRKDAENSGDEASLARLERAYDKIMMSQLTNRKKGLAFGSFQVSKDIKYADKQPIVPWGPRFSKSSAKDMKINLAISAVFAMWILIKRNVEYKPLQFLGFVYVYRIFEKLKAFEPAVSSTYNEDGVDEGRAIRMGKRLLRSLSLVFGCVAVASLGFTGILNLIEFLGQYIPLFLFNNQELFITVTSAVMLYIVATYYR